jgi:uncharacterized membrane protein YiaA
LGLSLSLLAIGLWNATLALECEKSFYAMSFATEPVRRCRGPKNVRDLALTDDHPVFDPMKDSE